MVPGPACEPRRRRARKSRSASAPRQSAAAPQIKYRSMGTKAKMNTQGGRALVCDHRGHAQDGARGLQAAHIFPGCWITDKAFETRLDGFLAPPKSGWEALLNSSANRIIFCSSVQDYFDGGSCDAGNLGCWTLVPVQDASGAAQCLVRSWAGVPDEDSCLTKTTTSRKIPWSPRTPRKFFTTILRKL